MKRKENESVKVFALGGVGEIGKNMYCVEIDSEIFIVDAGLMFPGDEMFGIDIVIPDITYLVENQERVKGLFITHGHEDHIGGIVYVLRKLSIPVYATKLTVGLIQEKLGEAGMLGRVDLKTIDSNSTVEFNTTTVSFFGTTHSIPDSVGVCFHTSKGAVVYTGDFKFDQTPIGNSGADLGKMAQIGNEGVLCLLSDRTNAERPGYTGSEKEVGVEINSLSKSYSLAGSRIGYMIGNEEIVRALTQFKSNTDYGVFLPIQKAASAALRNGAAFCEKNRNIYQERRDTLVDGFRTFGWNVDKPAGSMFVWAEIPQGWTSLDFAYALMDRANVVVTPGHAFGPHGEGFVRIALVQDKEVLQQVVENIRNSGIFVLEKVNELVKN